MKKLSLILLASVFTLSMNSCRETTEEKTDDTMELELETTTEDTYNEVDVEINEETEGTEEEME